MNILESKSEVVLVMFSQALFFPSLVLAGSGDQFLLMCLLACLQDLIAAHQA